jgi:UDP-glucuronate 4-epimerase
MNLVNGETIIITGMAGFIGYHLAKELARKFPDSKIIGIDNLNDYYSIQLKYDRLQHLKRYENIIFLEGDVADYEFLVKVSNDFPEVNYLFHLAAQGGVRASVDQPFKYTNSNLVGQVCMLEFAKQLTKLEKVIYASSSSVYGSTKKTIYREDLPHAKPLSLYSATKQAGELICDSYSRLFQIPMVGLRFFTAYGPYGRPDMAMFKIAYAIKNNRKVKLVGDGTIARDFTYIEDIISGIIKSANYSQEIDEKGYQNEIFNLGTGKKTDINTITKLIADNLGMKVEIEYVSQDLTDMQTTLADISKAKERFGYDPKVDLDQGIKYFITWFKEYYALQLAI